MATAAKAMMDRDALSVAEELALLTGEEIFAASQETSNKFNGIVLSKAVVIVQCRIRCFSLTDLAQRMGLCRRTLYSYARGGMVENGLFQRALRNLAMVMAE